VANEVVQDLLSALPDDREEVAERAEELLLRLEPASIQGVIAELQGGRSPERAAGLLGRIGDTRALEPLAEALEHRDISVRVEAASALGDLRDPAAVEPLLRATRDHNLDVRAEAGAALDALGTAAVVVGMSAVVRPLIADAVVSALQTQGPADRPAPVEPARVEEVEDAQEVRRPVGLLGVGDFGEALKEARSSGEEFR
jgi:HEAT repeat protein